MKEVSQEFSRSEALREHKIEVAVLCRSLTPSRGCVECADLVLQILLKRMFQNVIQGQTAAPEQTQSPAEELTPRDENVVRDMAGYVLHQLKKEYPQHSGFFLAIS